MQGKRSVTSIRYPRWLERPVLHRQRETALRQGYMMSCNRLLVGVFFPDLTLLPLRPQPVKDTPLLLNNDHKDNGQTSVKC